MERCKRILKETLEKFKLNTHGVNVKRFKLALLGPHLEKWALNMILEYCMVLKQRTPRSPVRAFSRILFARAAIQTATCLERRFALRA